MRKSLAAAAIAGALVAGGTAAYVFGPVLADAQTTTTTPPAGQNGQDQNGHFKSNEDPAHEAKETPEQEAAEDSGQFRGGHHGGPNDDPTHEANETPEQEQAEHAGGAGHGRTGGAGGATTSTTVTR